MSAAATGSTSPKTGRLGRAYLARMYRRYGNWPDAIAAYNWGPGNLDAWIGGGRPADKLPLAVERYRNRVLREAALAGPAYAWRLRRRCRHALGPLGAGPRPLRARQQCRIVCRAKPPSSEHPELAANATLVRPGRLALKPERLS